MQEEEFILAVENYANLRRCPIATGFKVLGKSWSVDILRELVLGRTRFNDIMRHSRGSNARMISLRMRELIEHGLVERLVAREDPVLIQYNLTARGRDLIPVMFAMASFSLKHFPEEVLADGLGRTPDQVMRELRRPQSLRNPTSGP
ncbi:MAG: helix-turn-helix transcriptional regulator [archaeon]|nr:MAG: helix-turn-helix transcriptional regulator [archaeon]